MRQTAPMRKRLVLASGSPYRASVLADAGIDVEIIAPEVDERSFDHLFVSLGAAEFAAFLARCKAESVCERAPGRVVLAGDQVGVLEGEDGTRQLNKQPDEDSATAQLLAMSGTTHRLVNAMVLMDTSTRRALTGIDVVEVTMRRYTEAEARAYVRAFEPFDCAGSYRWEDQRHLDPDQRLVRRVDGEHDSAVMGLPLPLVRRMLADFGVDELGGANP